jgi:hypothetical protein
VLLEVAVKQKGLKLNGTHQILLYANDVNILGGSVLTLRKNTGDLVVASKETGLKGNADETKYMVISSGQNVGRTHNVKNDNDSFESVEQFKYLRKILMNQNSIQEKIKSNLKSGSAYHHSEQNRLFSSLL